jgi:ubiquinone/menaquinone biosynthesis C-methylase UbiE
MTTPPMTTSDLERLFAGQIGAEYEMLKLICPAAAEMSQKVGEFVAGWEPAHPVQPPLQVFEMGCGTGMTTLALLHAREDIMVIAVDNEPTMLDQARKNLARWLEGGRLKLIEMDALSGLRDLSDHSIDLVASGYATHNFLEGYRRQVLAETFRALKTGGCFVNGDRYALDDTIEHTRLTQEEVRHYFKTFAAINRYDLLEQWIVHLFSDESPDHIMRLGPSLTRMKETGFKPVDVRFREGVNTLLVATKPAA